MGGFAYRVSHNWLVDVGYRYLDMGDAMSPFATNRVTAAPAHDPGLTAHEFRIGVRYNLD